MDLYFVIGTVGGVEKSRSDWVAHDISRASLGEFTPTPRLPPFHRFIERRLRALQRNTSATADGCHWMSQKEYVTDERGKRLNNATIVPYDVLAESLATLCPAWPPLVRQRPSTLDALRLPTRIKKRYQVSFVVPPMASILLTVRTLTRYGGRHHVDPESCATRTGESRVMLTSEVETLLRQVYADDFALVSAAVREMRSPLIRLNRSVLR